MAATVTREESFDPADFTGELEAAPGNLDVGTRLRFENEHIRVWEVTLQPGERTPFHAHTRRYFWTAVDGGTGRQRSADGSMITGEYHDGDTVYAEHSPGDPAIHDLENTGGTPLRFVTVELLD
jgi:oxalate decarboxylase/phosphoglucose isomerase-like protein (cupin superfamily)